MQDIILTLQSVAKDIVEHVLEYFSVCSLGAGSH